MEQNYARMLLYECLGDYIKCFSMIQKCAWSGEDINVETPSAKRAVLNNLFTTRHTGRSASHQFFLIIC